MCFGLAQADSYVDSLGADLVSRLPRGWVAKKGEWKYFDVKNCFQGTKSCAGNNPSSPYGYPSFADEQASGMTLAYQIGINEALVLIFRTPPDSRYYAFTPYFMKAHNSVEIDFASLSDSLNHRKLVTTGSVLPGGAPFNQYSVIVWTANINTYSQVQQIFVGLQFPETAVNLIPIPLAIPGFNFSLGYGENGDIYSMLMRIALPKSQTQLDAYMREKPFFVVKLNPDLNIEFNSLPAQGYSSTLSSLVEQEAYPNLQTALNMLVYDIKNKYASQYFFYKNNPDFPLKNGWDCITTTSICNGDNHDDLNSADTRVINVTSLQDMVIVVGVNHQKTGKATYLNHSVYDTVHSAGITSVTDVELTNESALYHAGVTAANDWRRILYKNLYAYVCDRLRLCWKKVLFIHSGTNSEQSCGSQSRRTFHCRGTQILRTQHPYSSRTATNCSSSDIGWNKTASVEVMTTKKPPI